MSEPSEHLDDTAHGDEFPIPISEGDDDTFELASRIAHDAAHMLPAPRGVAPRRRRRRSDVEQRFSSAGPDDRDPQPLSVALTNVVRHQGWTTELGLRRLLVGWADLVGHTNAQHSEPIAFADKVLVVRTSSTSWATELRRMAPQLVARLNEQLGSGSVERVEVRGPTAPSWKHGRRSVRDGRGPRDTYG